MKFKESVALLRNMSNGNDELAKKAKRMIGALDNKATPSVKEAVEALVKIAEGEGEDAEKAKKLLKPLIDDLVEAKKAKEAKEAKGGWTLPSAGHPTAAQAPELKSRMDEIMGLSRLEPGARSVGSRVILGHVPIRTA